MIFTKQQGDLQQSINRMAIPVFVVDRDAEGEFRVVALNAAHTSATGLQLDAVLAKTPEMILPDKADAEFLTDRYLACVRQGKPIVYSTCLTYGKVTKEIRTILHPVSLDGQAPTRLVGQVAITATMPTDTVRGALGDQGLLAKADIQAIEVILDDVRQRQTICSKDLMLLSVLMKNRSLSLSEVAGLVRDFDQSRNVQKLADIPVGQPPVIMA